MKKILYLILFLPVFLLGQTDPDKYGTLHEVGSDTNYIFSTGLTDASNTITNNLSTGVSGGQNIYGGTGSGDDLTLNSTTHGTKGDIFLGASSTYSGANIRLGINTITPSSKIVLLGNSLGTTQDSTMGLLVSNYTPAAVGNQQRSPMIIQGGSGWGTTGSAAQTVRFGTDVLPVQSTNPTGTLRWFSSVNNAAFTERMSLTSAGGLTTTGAITSGTGFIAGVGASGFSTSFGRLSTPTADGVWLIQNAAQTSVSRVQWGGTDNTFPAIKRVTTTLDVVLADDSGFAAMQSLYIRFGSGTPEGAVSAPVGATYSRTDGGAGTSFYVKESGGSGNTGWAAK